MDNNKKNVLIRFLATRWYIILALACIVETIGLHYRVLSIRTFLFIAFLIRAPYEYLMNQLDEVEQDDQIKHRNSVLATILVLIVVFGVIAEFVWPNKLWVLIVNLSVLTGVVIVSLIIKDKI